MGIFNIFRKSSFEVKISEACRITPRNITNEDKFVYGIVEFPIGIKKHCQYLSTSAYLMIDESLIAYRIAKYCYHDFLTQNGMSDNKSMLRVQERVQWALADLNEVSLDNVVSQWKNRSGHLPLLYPGNDRAQLTRFTQKASQIIQIEYNNKNGQEIESEDFYVLREFTRDTLIQAEVETFISGYYSIVSGQIGKMRLQ